MTFFVGVISQVIATDIDSGEYLTGSRKSFYTYLSLLARVTIETGVALSQLQKQQLPIDTQPSHQDSFEWGWLLRLPFCAWGGGQLSSAVPS